VPLVNGEKVATAEGQLKSAGLRFTTTDQANSTVKPGYVINSNPAEGNNVAADTVVTLVVSSGTAPVAVPNVVNEPEATANSTLQAKGFVVVTKTDTTSTVTAGTVLAQSPSGGTAAAGSTVTITISGGAITVPPVVGDSQTTASQILTTAGFTVTVQQGSGPAQYAAGTVFSQQPSANGTAAKGSAVIIYVQTSATPTTSPTPTPSPTGSAGPLGF